MRNRPRNPMPTRAIALVLIALFGFQISRIYLVTKVDAFFVCLNTDVWTSSQKTSDASPTEAQNELIFESFAAPSDDGSSYFRGCKDTFDGMGLSPLQPSALLATAGSQPLSASWADLASRAERGPETYLPPRFQPPKNLS